MTNNFLSLIVLPYRCQIGHPFKVKSRDILNELLQVLGNPRRLTSVVLSSRALSPLRCQLFSGVFLFRALADQRHPILAQHFEFKF